MTQLTRDSITAAGAPASEASGVIERYRALMAAHDAPQAW